MQINFLPNYLVPIEISTDFSLADYVGPYYFITSGNLTIYPSSMAGVPVGAQFLVKFYTNTITFYVEGAVEYNGIQNPLGSVTSSGTYGVMIFTFLGYTSGGVPRVDISGNFTQTNP